jgi:hypothetical protein
VVIHPGVEILRALQNVYSFELSVRQERGKGALPKADQHDMSTCDAVVCAANAYANVLGKQPVLST